MVLLDLITLSLLGTAATFALIELGLSAYVVSLGSDHVYTYWDPNYAGTGYGAYNYGTRHGASLPEVNFLLFCSLWTLMVAPALIVLPILWKNKSMLAGRDVHSIAAPMTLGLNVITTILWLAGFAALANLYEGLTALGLLGALLAFPVMLWLIFLALLILNLLTAFQVLKSEKLGWLPMFRRPGTASAPSSYPPVAGQVAPNWEMEEQNDKSTGNGYV